MSEAFVGLEHCATNGTGSVFTSLTRTMGLGRKMVVRDMIHNY